MTDEHLEHRNEFLADLMARVKYGVKGAIVVEAYSGKTDYWDEPIYEDTEAEVELLDVNCDGDIRVMAVNGTVDWADYIEEYQDNVDFTFEDFTPYLRPISDLRDDEIDSLFDFLGIDKDGNDESWIKVNDEIGIRFFLPDGGDVDDLARVFDYLNSIHIDYRGFIRFGMAKAATKEDIKKLDECSLEMQEEVDNEEFSFDKFIIGLEKN